MRAVNWPLIWQAFDVWIAVQEEDHEVQPEEMKDTIERLVNEQLRRCDLPRTH